MFDKVLLLLSLAGVALGGFGVMVADTSDPLDREMERLAPGAKPCGEVDLIGGARAAVNKCVTEQFLADQPFSARFERSCEDSICLIGIVLVAHRVIVVRYDSIGCHGKTPSVYCGTQAVYCDQATLVPKGERLKIRCVHEVEL